MGAEAEGVMEGLTNETMGINGTTTETIFVLKIESTMENRNEKTELRAGIESLKYECDAADRQFYVQSFHIN